MALRTEQVRDDARALRVAFRLKAIEGDRAQQLGDRLWDLAGTKDETEQIEMLSALYQGEALLRHVDRHPAHGHPAQHSSGGASVSPPSHPAQPRHSSGGAGIAPKPKG